MTDRTEIRASHRYPRDILPSFQTASDPAKASQLACTISFQSGSAAHSRGSPQVQEDKGRRGKAGGAGDLPHVTSRAKLRRHPYAPSVTPGTTTQSARCRLIFPDTTKNSEHPELSWGTQEPRSKVTASKERFDPTSTSCRSRSVHSPKPTRPRPRVRFPRRLPTAKPQASSRRGRAPSVPGCKSYELRKGYGKGGPSRCSCRLLLVRYRPRLENPLG